MVRNRDGWSVEVKVIDKIEKDNDGVTVTWNDGFSFFISKSKLRGVDLQTNDVVICYQNHLEIKGLVVDGVTLYYKTKEQSDDEHKQFRDNLRLKRLEEYVKNGQELKARAGRLHPKLAERMQRFSEESGEEFWIESAVYEMYALEGADALIRKVEELYPFNLPEERIAWLDYWWSLNTKKHNYNYTKQKQLVPDFGDGHSGNTAGAAYTLARRVVSGEPV